jgi:hypothetical protein
MEFRCGCKVVNFLQNQSKPGQCNKTFYNSNAKKTCGNKLVRSQRQIFFALVEFLQARSKVESNA